MRKFKSKACDEHERSATIHIIVDVEYLPVGCEVAKFGSLVHCDVRLCEIWLLKILFSVGVDIELLCDALVHPNSHLKINVDHTQEHW
jgi:hypothetical protein